MSVRIIKAHRLDQLAEVGNLAICDPTLAAFARQRSFARHRDYALTGLTHTLAESGEGVEKEAEVGARTVLDILNAQQELILTSCPDCTNPMARVEAGLD